MADIEKLKDRTVIGLYEAVTFLSNGNSKEVIVRIDTGATRSSIDVKLAASLKLGPVLTSKMVRSAHGSTLRPLVDAEIIIAGKKIKSTFTIADRNKMKYKVLIGQDILREACFLIDPCNCEKEQ